jgi:hypothetical protein
MLCSILVDNVGWGNFGVYRGAVSTPAQRLAVHAADLGRLAAIHAVSTAAGSD